jgi:hypothetical protein
VINAGGFSPSAHNPPYLFILHLVAALFFFMLMIGRAG